MRGAPVPTVAERLRAGLRAGALGCRALPWPDQTKEQRAQFAQRCQVSIVRGEGHMANCMFSWAIDMLYQLERG